MNESFFAFVLMPFDKAFKNVYKLGIQEPLKEIGVRAERVDDQHFQDERILDRIYSQIDSADFIIADMSGKNPNVFYEVGYAHAKSKTCILLTSNAQDIPFNLKHHKHIVYEIDSISDLKEKLLIETEAVIGGIRESRENLTADINVQSEVLDANEWRAVGLADIVINLRNLTKKSITIQAIYLHTGEQWEFTQDGKPCPHDSSDPQGGLSRKHLIRPNITSFTKNTWDSITIKGERKLGSASQGAIKSSYETRGNVSLKIQTNVGEIDFTKLLVATFDNIPF